MPVSWVKVEVPLAGMDTLTDPFHTLPVKLHSVKNARFDEPGGLTKRPSMVLVGNDTAEGSTVEDGIRLGQNERGQIVLFGTRQMYAFNGDDLRSWTRRGWYSDTSVSRSHIKASSEESLDNPDYARNGEVEVISWFATQSYFVRAVDTGVTLVRGTERLGRLINVGTKIYSIRGDVTNVQWSRITATNDTETLLTFPAHTSFPANALRGGVAALTGSPGNVSGCSVDGNTTDFILAYTRLSDGFLVVERFTDGTTPTLVWTTSLGEVADECFEVYADTTNVWVIWGRAGTGVRVNKLSFAAGAAATVSTIAIGAATGNARVAIRQLTSTRALAIAETEKTAAGAPPSEQLPVLSWAIVSTTVAIVGSAKTHCDLSILARPYQINTTIYLPVFHPGDGYGHGFSIAIADTTPAALTASWRATFARDLAAGQLSISDNSLGSNTIIPGVYNSFTAGVNQGSVVFPMRIRERFEFAKENDDPIVRAHTGISTIQITHGGPQANWCTWGSGMFIAGGRPSWYDGTLLAEHGFAWQPSVNRDGDNSSDITEIVASPFTTGDVYQAQLAFYWQDSQRMIQYSEPSAVMEEVINGASVELRITFRNVLLSDRRASDGIFTRGSHLARVQVYRTIEGPGPVFFRGFGTTGYAIPTDTTVATNLDFGSGTGEADADIQDNEVLYTQGGILPNTGTPPANICHVHGARMWLAGLEDGHDLWFSQPFVETEAPRFNGLLKLRMETEVTALGSSDERLIVFSDNAIRAVSGSGPSASGGLDLGFNVETISANLGQAPALGNTGGHRNVVQCPLGLFFVTKGLEIKLLDRSLTVQNIGDPMKRTLQDSYPFVYCGMHVADQQHVRYLVYGATGAAVLIYDYRVGEWCMDTFHVSYLPVDMMNFTGGTSPVVWHLDSAGNTFREDPDDGVDNDIPFVMSFETPWIKLDTLQGWQRVRSVTLLGRKATSQSSITIVLYMNYEDETPVGFKTFAGTEINNMAGERLQLKYRFPRQKCQSFKVLVLETPEGDEDGTGVGQHFSSLVFEAGLKKGVFKMGIERKTGAETINGVTP